MKTHHTIETLDYQIEQLQQRKTALLGLLPKILPLNLEFSFCNEHLDFDNLSHEDVIRVIVAIGGKWKKSVSSMSGDRIDYTYDGSFDGIVPRCWAGSPPPSCRIVDEEVEVPETVTPATRKIVRRMICAGEVPA